MGISKINKNNIVGHNSDSINGILTPIIFREVLFTRFNLRDLNPASATKRKRNPFGLRFLFVVNSEFSYFMWRITFS